MSADETHYILEALSEYNRTWGEEVTLVQMLADKEFRSKMYARAQQLKTLEQSLTEVQ